MPHPISMSKPMKNALAGGKTVTKVPHPELAPPRPNWSMAQSIYQAVRTVVVQAYGMTTAQIAGALGVSRGHHTDYPRVVAACRDLPRELRARVRGLEKEVLPSFVNQPSKKARAVSQP